MNETTTPEMMSSRLKLAVGAYIVLLNAVLTAVLVTAWPNVSEQTSSLESRYLLCAATAGALGSYIHLATSFIEHAGSGSLARGWTWWYLMRPWIGSSLALVVYFVLRAGLITPASGAVNPYGIAAVAAMSGMFSHQATRKLREIFENICAVRRTD